MFDIGFQELALIGIIALLVVGPERMPGLIRTIGQWAGQLQRLARDLRREIEMEAEAEDFKALQADFLAEDRRLKEAARATASTATPTPAATDDESAETLPPEPADEDEQSAADLSPAAPETAVVAAAETAAPETEKQAS